MEDSLKRLGQVGTRGSELRSQGTAILTVSPPLATKADVADVRSAVGAVEAVIPQLATKADVAAVKADVAAIETAIIKWIIATTLTSAALAFAIAKFVH